MAIPLVHMFPNSIILTLDGSWNISPGDNTMNNTTATTTGPQSAFISLGIIFQIQCLVFYVGFRVFLVAKLPSFYTLVVGGAVVKEMSGDWGPVLVATVLFVLCTPGLLCQLPGNKRGVEFANFQTSPISIFVHTIIFFGLVTIFVIAIGIHISSG
ncbi:hypothetical protein V6N13_123441 [Hibiscus sabdariffa]